MTVLNHKIKYLLLPLLTLLFACFSGCAAKVRSHSAPDTVPYRLDTELESRAASAENPTGEKGSGGKAASHLGIGRKGSPNVRIKPGQTVVLCNIKVPGTIRHIWMAGTINSDRLSLRSAVIRAYWENQKHPSIECPLGDFMGLAHAIVKSYQSAAHSIGKLTALNIWLPMPFEKNAKITLTNESGKDILLWYQVDYTIGDQHPKDFGRLHVCFRRENPTTVKKDFVILPKRTGKGRYIGAVLGIHTLGPHWWGEGEIKIYIDGDTKFPTICGTGSEDYVGLSYGVQHTPFYYHGCSLDENGFISMYRWHLLDPIYWKKDCYITIQQIGWDKGLVERQDDWSAAAFWYEPIPSMPLPPFPTLEGRVADLNIE